MKSTKLLTTGLLALTLTTGAFLTHTQAFNNSERSEQRRAAWQEMTDDERQAKRAEKELVRENSTKTVTNVDNGVQIIVTTENDEVLTLLHKKTDEKIARMAEKEPRENVTKSMTKTTNGFMVTITSTDAEIVEKIQNRAEKGKNRMKRRGFGKRGQRNQ